jgi:segregation and condensation protein A
MDTAAHQIKTDVFEGPLELLIELVEKRKLLINDISLAAVTDEYMAAVADRQGRSLPDTAQFVILAATLLLIKSKSLLPELELTAEEEEQIDDLEGRIKRYQYYKLIGEELRAMFSTRLLATPVSRPPKEPVFTPDSYCDQPALSEALGAVVARLEPAASQPVKATSRPIISLEETIRSVEDRVQRAFRTSFQQLTPADQSCNTVAIVHFLAILELCKNGSLLAAQTTPLADITLEHVAYETPRY